VLDRSFGLRLKYLKAPLSGIIFILFFSYSLLAQENKKGETLFGLEVKAIIPGKILNAGPISLGDDSIDVTIKSPNGYSIGMVVRHNFTKMFSLETGLHLTNSYYHIQFENSNKGIISESKIQLVSYEIPIQWLLYIRLGEQVYMNTILGISLDIFPTDVTVTEDSYAYIIILDSWIQASLLASVGFEYRTEKSGFFYMGASLHRPFNDIGNFSLSYYNNNSLTEYVTFSSPITGTYLSMDFRYFFPKKEKIVAPKYY